MAHVPHALAKRLDRLARRAHRFHRFAHHPLCERYRGELIAIGKKDRICRGCAFAALGCALGSAFGVLLPLQRLQVGRDGIAAIGFVPLAFALVAMWIALQPSPPIARERSSKLVTRLLPAALLICAAVLGARAASPLGLALCIVSALIVARLHAAYRRRGPDRTPCATCPERGASVCSGLAPIVRRERAFIRYSRKLLA
jgi:hypothetical protein